MQTWYYNNGLATYKLEISPSNAPGQTYHIAYTWPGGYSSTDMCISTGFNKFNCSDGTGAQGELDPNLHAVKFTSISGTFTYYDLNYMPTNPSILGTWYTQTSYPNGDKQNNYILISKGNDENHYSVSTQSNDDRGNTCGNPPDQFAIINNPDGTQTLIYDSGRYGKQTFKYDTQNNIITSTDFSQDTKVGWCIFFSSNKPFAFKKQ